MHPDISPYIYIIFTAATAVGVLIQAGVLLGLFIGFRRFQGKIELILTHVTDHALPLIASSKVTLEELAPKLKTISNNLVDISETLKHESQNVKVSVDDVLEKTRAQTARVDEMVSGTLDGITHAGAAIQQGVEVPLRHLHGIFNGLRAGFSTFREKKAGEPVVAAAEKDFVVVVEEVASGRDIS
jgi:hypothetical protein